MFASAYGLTVEQFLSYTPRQVQEISEILRIRLHNERALQAQLNGFDADFMDLEHEKMLKDISRQHDEDAKKRNHDTLHKNMISEIKDQKNG